MNTWTGSILAFVLGIVYIALGYPLYRRLVAPNNLYGFRIRRTTQNPSVWYPVNERSGKHLVIIGLLLIVLGAISLIIGGTETRQEIVIWTTLGLALGGALYSMIVCYRMAVVLADHPKQSEID